MRSLRGKVDALLQVNDEQWQRPSTASEVLFSHANQQDKEKGVLRKKHSVQSLSVSWSSTLAKSTDHQGNKIPRRAGSHSQLRFVAGNDSHPSYDPERLSNLFRQSAQPPVAGNPSVAGGRGATLIRTTSKDSAMSVTSFRTAPDVETTENMSPTTEAGAAPPSASETLIELDEEPTFASENRSVLEAIQSNLSATSSMSTLLCTLSPPTVLQPHMDPAVVRRHQGILTSLETSLSALRGDCDELIFKWEVQGDKLGEELVTAMRKTDQAKEQYWSSVGSAVVGAFVAPTS